MKKLPLLLLILVTSVCLSGCKSTSFTQKLSNGTEVVFHDQRWFFSTAADISAAIDPTNGVVNVRVGVQSKTDGEALAAVVSAAVEAAVKGVKP